MGLTNYVSAMDCWKGRIDSTTDYDAFRWHQWVQPLDLNIQTEKPECELGFAFIGFCSEQGVKRNKGRVGTALAPDFIRAQMSNLPCTFLQDVKLYDAGNILCDEISMEEGQKLLGMAVEKILDLELFPIVLGGGHETTFGHFQGHLADMKKKETPVDMGIINFDAHFDYLPLGIQEHSNTVSLFKFAKEIGTEYILAKEIQNSNYATILDKVDTFLYQCSSAYITVCTDVFSSAFAPGVSATQSLGLDPEVVLPIIKHILRTRRVRGFDICEISPRFDQDNTTANLGAVIIFAVVNTLCKLNNLAIDVLE